MDETTARSDVVVPEARSHPADPEAVRPRLVRLAFRFLWNRDDAEDVAMEALLIAQQQGDRLRDTGKWWSWLSRIVVNRCHEHGRRRQRNGRLDDALRDQAMRSEMVVADSTASDAGTIKDAVRDALPQLARRQREVIVLRHLHGMTYAEVGEVLGISATTARVHARAGREALRKLLVERVPELLEQAVQERDANRTSNGQDAPASNQGDSDFVESVQLTHADAHEMAGVIHQLGFQLAVVAAPDGKILVRGAKVEVARAMEIVAKLDTPGAADSAGVRAEFIPIGNIGADNLKSAVSSLITGPHSRFAVDRANHMLVVRALEDEIASIRDFLSRVD